MITRGAGDAIGFSCYSQQGRGQSFVLGARQRTVANNGSEMSELDNDIEALLSSRRLAPVKICKVKYLLDQVTPEQAGKLGKLFDAGVVPAPQLVAVLRKNGFEMVTDRAITRHRRRKAGSGCSCP